MLYLIGIGLFILFILLTYKVVEPNEAHIVITMGRGRKVYSPNIEKDVDGKIIKKSKTAYIFVPLIMQREILPLANVKMEIPGFPLNDMEMAPFECLVTCWFRITEPGIAVEKLDLRAEDPEGEETNFEYSVRQTLEEQVRGIARAAAMKQEVLDIMRDRKTFGDRVEEEVNGALVEWGLELVKLEIVNFSDSKDSLVLKNYEKARESEIESNSRKKIAEQNKLAEVIEAKTAQEAGIAKADSEREIEKANVEKNKQVNIANQEAEMEVAKKAEEANEQKVEATRTLEVGKASVVKEAKIE